MPHEIVDALGGFSQRLSKFKRQQGAMGSVSSATCPLAIIFPHFKVMRTWVMLCPCLHRVPYIAPMSYLSRGGGHKSWSQEDSTQETDHELTVSDVVMKVLLAARPLGLSMPPAQVGGWVNLFNSELWVFPASGLHPGRSRLCAHAQEVMESWTL